MSSYSLKCRKNTESLNPKVSKTNNDKTMISKCAICGSKKSFVKKIWSKCNIKWFRSSSTIKQDSIIAWYLV